MRKEKALTVQQLRLAELECAIQMEGEATTLQVIETIYRQASQHRGDEVQAIITEGMRKLVERMEQLTAD